MLIQETKKKKGKKKENDVHIEDDRWLVGVYI